MLLAPMTDPSVPQIDIRLAEGDADLASIRELFVDYQTDAVIRYKAFPAYWGGKQKIDQLVFAITPDASVRYAKLKKNECQVMPYPNPADLPQMRKEANINLIYAARDEALAKQIGPLVRELFGA